MIPVANLKKYNKKFDYTYTLGTFPTFELLNNHPEYLHEVLISTQVNEEIREKIMSLCGEKNIPVITNDRVIDKIRDKEASIVVGVLRKYDNSLENVKDHVVLVNPSDMGNLGTIIRTCVGFGIKNLAIIEPAADVFNPKVIRASMGALFSINCERFSSFEEYQKKYGAGRNFFPFMLKGAVALDKLNRDLNVPYSLIFGNEATGLDDGFLSVGQSVLINHSKDIDSLNLSMAVGIALYEFTKDNFS